ncbi:response regulator [Streptomyces caniferus]|uniref:response regulator n=1 Tax=Streptomyces caniferus TaxID=285557 RepID=UPI0037111487
MARFLREHDLPGGDVDRRGEVLSRLERQLPSGFPDMVADQEFTSLIDGLVALPRSEELLLRLRAGAALPAAVQPEPAAHLRSSPSGTQTPAPAYGAAQTTAPRADGALLRGVHILWVDDHPRNNDVLAGAFRAAGAVVRIARDSGAADEALAVETPTLIISDIERDGNPREGLEHIARLRRDGRYAGPVVFYAGRVTPERKTVARELGAHLTSSGTEIERLIVRAAQAEPPPDAVRPWIRGPAALDARSAASMASRGGESVGRSPSEIDSTRRAPSAAGRHLGLSRGKDRPAAETLKSLQIRTPSPRMSAHTGAFRPRRGSGVRS